MVESRWFFFFFFLGFAAFLEKIESKMEKGEGIEMNLRFGEEKLEEGLLLLLMLLG